MRNLYRVAHGLPTHSVMIALLRAPASFRPTEVKGVEEFSVRSAEMRDDAPNLSFPALKKLALGAMQLIEGSVLGQVTIVRIEPKASLNIPEAASDDPNWMDHLFITLNASAASRIMADDEAAEVRAGDIWWSKPDQLTRLINGNGADDDLVVLICDIRADN